MKIKTLVMLMLLGSAINTLPMAAYAENAHADHDEESHDDHEKGNAGSHAEHKKEHGDDHKEDGHKDDHDDDHKDGHNEGSDKHGDESEGGHGDEHGEHEEEGVTKLTPAQMKLAGIKVTRLESGTIHSAITAPGEVRFNTYKTSSITPRISAQLIARHVVLGEEVKKGQSVVTLSSVEMADAQGDLLVADREWSRVKKLGKKVVSERRYTEAKVNWELAKAKVKAYGMVDTEVRKLLSSDDFSLANGRFNLVATTSGTVLVENFIRGQQVEPGQEIILITDESHLWVTANVSPQNASKISIGNHASVKSNKQIFKAKVAQISHTLDESTRTTSIRLDVENQNDMLHPGQFVTAEIETSASEQALNVPEAAVLRSADGDWEVYVEQDEEGEFKAVEIKLVRVTGGIAIIEGLKVGTPVVTQGAFFVQSELAKSGFEVHNH